MAIRYQTFFLTKGRHWSPLNFRWAHFSVLIFFLVRFLLHFGEDLCLVLYEQVITRYLRTGFGLKLLGTLK